MTQYFYGPDTYAARQAIDEEAVLQEATIRHFYQDDSVAEQLTALFEQRMSLFGAQLSVVHNPSQLPKALQEELASMLNNRASADIILWDQTLPDKRSKLWRAVKDSAREFSNLTSVALSTWLQQLATEAGQVISESAAALLVTRVGLDRWRLSAELNRLLLLADAIDVGLVTEQTVTDTPAEIFATLDAIARGKAAVATQAVERLLAAGDSEFYILSMLAYQFRTLLVIKTGIADNQSVAAIAQVNGIHPYVITKNQSVLVRYTREQLLTALTRIMATDFAIKQGRVDARTGVIMLVLGLSGGATVPAVAAAK